MAGAFHPTHVLDDYNIMVHRSFWVIQRVFSKVFLVVGVCHKKKVEDSILPLDKICDAPSIVALIRVSHHRKRIQKTGVLSLLRGENGVERCIMLLSNRGRSVLRRLVSILIVHDTLTISQ
jgi:hypothetical protein